MKLRRLVLLAIATVSLLLPSAADAATRREFIGGSYGEAWPGGAVAVLINWSHVETHLGVIPLPAMERAAGGLGPLYLIGTVRGGFHFAGQSHAGLGTWEWSTDRGWVLLGQACGVSPAIYDAGGALHISNCSVGSQGWRYVEDGTGRLVTGDETYVDAPRRIWEWTTHGDITIGQGADGCIAIRGADRRVLEPGDCHFVRFNREGDALAVSMAKFAEGKAVVLWLTAQELTTFPREADPPAPPPPPPPPPVDPPVVDPPQTGPSQRGTVERIRLKYPTPLGARHWEFLVEVAQATGGKLFRKDAGDSIVFVPPLNLTVSQDIIIVGTEWIDILIDGEGRAKPDWDAHPNAGESKKWLDVSGIKLPGGPVDQPPPPPPPPPPGGVTRADMDAAINAAIVKLHTELWNEVAFSQSAIFSRLERLEARPLVDLLALGAAIDTALANYEVNGKTRTDRLGLQHQVQLSITRKK